MTISVGSLRSVAYGLFGIGIVLLASTKSQPFFGYIIPPNWVDSIGTFCFLIGCGWLGQSEGAILNNFPPPGNNDK